jgi:hypothetical protein
MPTLLVDLVSSHNIGKLRLIDGERLLAEYKAIEEVVFRHQRIIENNPAARIVWLEGNHCYRVTRYLDAHPELEGLLEIPIVLKLKERGIEWIPSWSEGKTFKAWQTDVASAAEISEWSKSMAAGIHGARC